MRRDFAGMLSAVDEGIGNLTAALATRGMLDNTLLVVTAGTLTSRRCIVCC